MTYTYQKLKRRKDAGEIDGFTLIELLIVIVVLGILAAVVIFALGGITGQSALSACQADGATVATAMSAFNAENAGTPATIGDLTGSTLGGPYISSWPTNGTHYGFGLNADGTLIVEAPWTASSGTYPTTIGGGTTAVASGIAYTGPTSCTGVK